MTRTLLIVDVQNCFLNAFTRHIPQRIAELLRRGQYDQVLFTRFVNLPNSPYQRLLQWTDCGQAPGTDLAPELSAFARTDNVFVKPGLNGLPDDLARHLSQQQVRSIALAGIDTDMCVLKCAMDIFDLGIEPEVLIDCCASTAGLQAHFAGLAVLSRNIGPQQLRSTGLNPGPITEPGVSDAAVPPRAARSAGSSVSSG